MNPWQVQIGNMCAAAARKVVVAEPVPERRKMSKCNMRAHAVHQQRKADLKAEILKAVDHKPGRTAVAIGAEINKCDDTVRIRLSELQREGYVRCAKHKKVMKWWPA